QGISCAIGARRGGYRHCDSCLTNAVDKLEDAGNRNGIGRGLPEKFVLEIPVLLQPLVRQWTEEVKENILAFSPVHDEVQFVVGDLFSEGSQKFPPGKTVCWMAVHNDAIHIENHRLQSRPGLRRAS